MILLLTVLESFIYLWCEGEILVCFVIFRNFVALFLYEKTVTEIIYLDMLQVCLIPQLEDNQPNVVF
jgi:hypothetical protein